MRVSVTELSQSQRRLEVEFPAERVAEEIERAYRAMQSRIRVSGFRAGKVPRRLLERRFGEQAGEEVSARLVEESYGRILDEHGLRAVARPRIVAGTVGLGQPFHYSAVVEVQPEIVVRDYEGLEVQRQAVKVEDGEVDDALARLREAMAHVRPAGERDRVERGDVVIVDYVGFVEGRPVNGLSGANQAVEVGKGRIIPELEERLIGLQKGSPADVAVRYPGEGVRPDLAGRLVDFRVTVKEIGVKEMAALDDEFARDHGECETLAELRDRVRDDLRAAAERREDRRVRDELVERLLESNPVEAPPSVVERQFQRLAAELGLDPGPGAGEQAGARLSEELRDELVRRARRQVQGTLLLEALARQEGLSVGEAELEERVAAIAAAAGEQARQVQALYRSEEHREGLRAQRLREKALALVVDRAKIKSVQDIVAPRAQKD